MTAILADSMPVADAAALLGVTPARVRQVLGERSLIGIRTDEGWLVPRYQLVVRQPVRGLRAVAQALPPTIHPVALHTWFTSPSPALILEGRPVSPRDWLASGGPPDSRDVGPSSPRGHDHLRQQQGRFEVDLVVEVGLRESRGAWWGGAARLVVDLGPHGVPI